MYGDSKSSPDTNTWPQKLAADAGMRALVLGRGGYTVATTLSNLTSDFDDPFTSALIPSALTGCETSGTILDRCAEALHDQQPPIILLNLGVNDMGYVTPWTLPNEATWKTNYLAILDGLHAQWPGAKIYLTTPWKTQSGGTDSFFDTMAGWITDVTALRSTFVFAGDDERVWFKPSIATYSDDGIHINAAGQLEAAAQRYAILFP